MFGAANNASCKLVTPKGPRAGAQEAASVPAKRPALTWTDELATCGVMAQFLGTPNDEQRDVRTKGGSVKMTFARPSWKAARARWWFLPAQHRPRSSQPPAPWMARVTECSRVLERRSAMSATS